jgi:hypothetical protein
MSALVVKADGYDTWTDESETGMKAGAFPPFVSFSNDHRFVLRDDTELPRDSKEFLAPDVKRSVLKWPPIRGQAPERFPLAPGAPWPDIEARNENAPKAEWVANPDGTMRGPWAMEHQLMLLDAETMAPYLFVTQTTGGNTAVSELVKQTRAKRQLYGEHVCPVVTLSTTLWSKRFKRLRPRFVVQRYVKFGDGPAELSGPGTEAAKPVMREVPNPTLREELKDEVKY